MPVLADSNDLWDILKVYGVSVCFQGCKCLCVCGGTAQ